MGRDSFPSRHDAFDNFVRIVFVMVFVYSPVTWSNVGGFHIIQV